MVGQVNELPRVFCSTDVVDISTIGTMQNTVAPTNPRVTLRLGVDVQGAVGRFCEAQLWF
jgi:hypothetical protein